MMRAQVPYEVLVVDVAVQETMNSCPHQQDHAYFFDEVLSGGAHGAMQRWHPQATINFPVALKQPHAPKPAFAAAESPALPRAA